jgi:hypothetical protein
MNKTLLASLAMAATLGAAALLDTSDAQTPQGDILRGQGRFLEGAGWYNLNTARADRINVETWKQQNREVERLYRNFLMDKHMHTVHNKKLGSKVQEDYRRKFEEAQFRWRTNPTPEDITSGDALNALAIDLADASIGPSSWRTARVDLPPDMSLTGLAFKVADKKRSALLQSTVAVDRMLVKAGWPLPFRRPEVESECEAYKKAVESVVAKCIKGTELQGKDFDRLRDSVTVLLRKVDEAVTARDNQKAQAREYVRRLDDATRIFAEQEFAERLIRDVSEHKATTIAELLGFMRQYRLLFADSGSSPEVRNLYDGLYGLLRRQKEAIGIPNAPPPKPARPSDVFQVGTVWAGVGPAGGAWTVTVLERTPNGFTARFKVGNSIRDIRGEVADDRISWRPQDVHTLKGAQPKGAVAGATVAIFHGDALHLRLGNPNANVKAKAKAMAKTNVLILHRAP